MRAECGPVSCCAQLTHLSKEHEDGESCIVWLYNVSPLQGITVHMEFTLLLQHIQNPRAGQPDSHTETSSAAHRAGIHQLRQHVLMALCVSDTWHNGCRER